MRDAVRVAGAEGTGRRGVSAGHSHGSDGRAGSRRALGWSLALTVVFGGLQVVGGLVFGSLALLADSVHNISDGLALGLALGAAWLAGLPARGARTFGWRRAEILAALLNALTLVAVSGWIFWEAYQRLSSPPDVVGWGVVGVGLVGVAANGVPVWLMLRDGDRSNLNLQGALIHAATDVVGSGGAVVAGVIVVTTGWTLADPIVGAVIGVIVLVSSFGLLRESVRILLEVAPGQLAPDEISSAMALIGGVDHVAALHLWTITSGFDALSAHVIVEAEADHDTVLHALQALLVDRFGITHTTIQLDRDHRADPYAGQCPECPLPAPPSSAR